MELQREAQNGDVKKLLATSEQRIREEFGLSSVRVSLPRGADWAPQRAPGGLGHCVQFRMRNGVGELGLVEACSTVAFLADETTVALEFLAEQLPALINHCCLIEEKLRLERDLAERERLALVGQMAASISHNLLTPLSSMKTILQVLLEDRNLTPRVREDCDLVVHEIDRLSKMLTHLLQCAKPSVRLAGGEKAISVAPLAEQMVSLLRYEAERSSVRLEFVQESSEILVRGTDDAWSDVISNLVVNAIEAQPAGGNVRLSITSSDSHMRMEITDDGPGISASLGARLFQPFFTTKPSGTGLSLAIVARRVVEMGGEIKWERPVRGGRRARFIATLPVGNAQNSVGSKATEGRRASWEQF